MENSGKKNQEETLPMKKKKKVKPRWRRACFPFFLLISKQEVEYTRAAFFLSLPLCFVSVSYLLGIRKSKFLAYPEETHRNFVFLDIHCEICETSILSRGPLYETILLLNNVHSPRSLLYIMATTFLHNPCLSQTPPKACMNNGLLNISNLLTRTSFPHKSAHRVLVYKWYLNFFPTHRHKKALNNRGLTRWLGREGCIQQCKMERGTRMVRMNCPGLGV